MLKASLERSADEEDAVEEGASGLVQLPPRPPEQPQLLLQPVELGVVVVGRRAALVPLLDALDLRWDQVVSRDFPRSRCKS